MRPNPLRSGRHETVGIQGEISGKGFPDWDDIAYRERSSNNATLLKNSYRGFSEENMAIMPGELILGQRSRRAYYVGYGEPNEVGLTSCNGMVYSNYHNSREILQRALYCLGVSKTAYKVGARDREPEQGFSFLRVGLITLTNPVPMTIFAGSPVQWRLPLIPSDPGYQKHDVYVHNGRGTPNTKCLPEIVPFDFTDYDSNVAAAYTLMTVPRNQADMRVAGIQDVEFDSLFDSAGGSAANLTPLQEEAMGYKFGLVGVVLAGLDYLVREGKVAIAGDVSVSDLAENLGLWSDKEEDQKDVLGIVAEVIGRDNAMSDQRRNFADRFPNMTDPVISATTPAEKYNKLRNHLVRVLLGGLSASWAANTSRVLGRAARTVVPGENADVIMGHYKP